MAERVNKYTKTEVFDSNGAKSRLERMIRSPFYKHHNELPAEDGENFMFEVVSDQNKVTDDKLVHVGVGILQQSKLLFLRFVEFLREFLEPGSFQPIYAGSFYFIGSYIFRLENKFKIYIILRHGQPLPWPIKV